MTTKPRTAAELDLTERERKIIMMVMKVGYVPPDMPADLALEILQGAGERGGKKPRSGPRPAIEPPPPSRAWTIWTRLRAPLIVAAVGGLVLYANLTP